jgi:hypothetical protein
VHQTQGKKAKQVRSLDSDKAPVVSHNSIYNQSELVRRQDQNGRIPSEYCDKFEASFFG